MSRSKVGERLTDSTLHNREVISSYMCGWSVFQPKYLQKSFNNAKAFLILMTLANITQGIVVNGILKVSITSIERRFNLLSSESGLIVSGYDIAGCISLLPISYLGGKGHKPRWIGWGMVVASVGSLVLALPHFLTGPYQYKTTFSSSNSFSINSNHATGNITTSELCRYGMQNINPGLNDLKEPMDASVKCEELTTTLVSHFSLKQMKFIFLFGQFLNGIGCTPLSVLGVTFIDESVDPQVYPIYIGIYYMGALLGPAIGFILGGQLLKVFTEIDVTPDITPDSPQWVGAWWVGFVICAGILFLLAILILAYPRKLPSTFTRKTTLIDIKAEQYPSRDEMSAATVGSSCATGIDEDASLRQIRHPSGQQALREQAIPLQVDTERLRGTQTMSSLRSAKDDVEIRNSEPSLRCDLVQKFFADLLQVVTNKAFLFLSLSAAVLGTLVSGFSTFGPKYVESQFGKSASDAANLFGYVVIPAGAAGMLLGSCAMSGLKLGYKSALRMCFCISLLGLFAQFSLTLHCDDMPLAGVNVPYASHSSSSSDELPLTVKQLCNSACTCPRYAFEPVCGSDGVTYYSPCFAGCSQHTDDASGHQVYSNCSCILGSSRNSTSIAEHRNATTTDVLRDLSGSATTGKCVEVCWWYDVIMTGLFLVIMTTFMCAVPGVDLSLRCFPHHLRSLAIGVQWILIRTLGMIPGPIIFGAMIDSTCQVWHRADLCSPGLGSCMMYKNKELSFSMLILSLIYKGASILFFGLALFFYKPARLVGTKEEDDTERRVTESPL